jgi:hypothetical protein
MKVLKNFKLIGISMLFIVGLTACGKQGSTATATSKTTVTAQKNQIVVKPPQVFRIMDNPKGNQIYIDAKSVNYAQDASDLSSGFILINFDRPMQFEHNKNYQSEVQVIVAKCKQNLIMISNRWLFAGTGMTGEYIGSSLKPSELITPPPGSSSEGIKNALCFSNPDDLERVLDKIQQVAPEYPPIKNVVNKMSE